MRVLVCGGRDYQDREKVFKALSDIHADRIITDLHEGGAEGVDRLAFEWGCQYLRILKVRWEADWKKHGRAAGPIRNQRMIDEGKPDIVLAFPGGRGTADMVRRARAAGVEVIEIA